MSRTLFAVSLVICTLLLIGGCERPTRPREQPTPTLITLPSLVVTPGSEAAFPPASTDSDDSGGAPVERLITEHLQQGGAPDDLIDRLEEMGFEAGPNGILKEDLNGDGEAEWILLMRDPARSRDDPANPHAFFAILQAPPARPGRWRDDNRQLETEEAQPFMLAYFDLFSAALGSLPEILTIRDLSGDGEEDVLWQDTGCGAHTCTTYYSLVSYHGADVPSERLQSDPLSGSRPGAAVLNVWRVEWHLQDWDRDGRDDLLILGNYRGNYGGGPQRGVVDIYYSLEGGQFLWRNGAWLPSNVRYFRLRDADILIGRQMYQEAIQLLDEVVHSDDLEASGWEGFREGRDEDGDVRRFAYLRAMQAALLLKNRPLAAKYYREMKALWPDHDLTILAGYELYDVTDFWEGCERAKEFALTIPGLTGSLADMGMSNPTITNEDFCPIRGFGDAIMPLLIPGIDYDPAILP